MQYSAATRPVTAAGLLLAVLLLGVTQLSNRATGHAKATDRADESTVDELPMLTGEQAGVLERKMQQLYTRLSPSVVRIWGQDEQGRAFDEHGNPTRAGGSGVIISASGHVLTAAHLNLPPRTRITVELSDGRRVQGTALGHFRGSKTGQKRRPRALDLGLIRLDGNRRWTAASPGNSALRRPGELCLSIGYPGVLKPGQPPLLRLGRMLPPLPNGAPRTSCRALPGDSGGPLFDMEGRVLGIFSGHASLRWASSEYAPIEEFLKVRDRLLAGEELDGDRELIPFKSPQYRWGAFEPTEEWSRTLGRVSQSVVQILGDGKPVALGLIVGADGWVVTKRTELAGYRSIACRLSDGREWEAKVVAGSVPHDLALLKGNATGLTPPRWGPAKALRTGQIVASIGTASQPLHGAVISAPHAITPALQGYLPINGKPAPEGTSGLLFTKVWDRADTVEAQKILQPDDLITHLNGVPTRTAEEYVRVRDGLLAAPKGLTGERFLLTIQRGPQTFQVAVPIIPSAFPPPYEWKQCPLNLRRYGFPHVLVHDGGISPEECSGPVVDRLGRVIGINIARADAIQTFAIPADVARKVIAELMVQGRKAPLASP